MRPQDFEKPQKRNPHQLTVRQHVFPQFLIKNFCDANGRVSFFEKSSTNTSLKTPSDASFCAYRVWDQQAESGYMKDIEGDFERLSKSIFDKKTVQLSKEDQEIATEMFCIWNLRHFYRKNPIPDQKLNGVTGLSYNYTKDEQEQLEKAHIGFARDDASIPGRQVVSVRIQLQMFEIKKRLFSEGAWAIVTSKNADFLVPDNFNKGILPISPRIALMFGCSAQEIDTDDVALINGWAVNSSSDYYFGRDLTSCPIKQN